MLVEQPGGGPPRSLMAMLPTAEVEIHDMWHVVGLKGTGSCDYSVSDHFVPAGFTFDLQAFQPQRGGSLYRIGLPSLLQSVHAGFALGVGRRALDAIIDLARTKRRGYGKQTPLAERAVFQHVIGESDLRLRAARGLVLEILEKVWATACGDRKLDAQLHIELRSATTLATEVALDVATQAFRYGGGTAIHLHSILQRCLRDLQVGAAHLMVSDSTYELHGQCLLGLRE